MIYYYYGTTKFVPYCKTFWVGKQYGTEVVPVYHTHTTVPIQFKLFRTSGGTNDRHAYMT
jgi:hypothetical protein